MTITRLITSATAVAALATAGVASAAEAPVVSKQGTLTRTAPVTIPGTGVQKGERLPAGARIVFRDVTVAKGQTARLHLRAPDGKRLRGIGVREGGKVAFQLDQRRSYVGRTRVALRASPARGAGRDAVTDRVYALAR